jgi:hypothetical protein
MIRVLRVRILLHVKARCPMADPGAYRRLMEVTLPLTPGMSWLRQRTRTPHFATKLPQIPHKYARFFGVGAGIVLQWTAQMMVALGAIPVGEQRGSTIIQRTHCRQQSEEGKEF